MKNTHKTEIESAWNAFFEAAKMDDIDTLRAEGWMTTNDYVDACISRGINVDHRRAKYILSSKEFDVKQVVLKLDDKSRKMNVYRPKVGQKQK